MIYGDSRRVAARVRSAAEGVGNQPLAILPDHRERAAGQIAEAVRQFRVVAAHQRVVTEAAVLPEDDSRNRK